MERSRPYCPHHFVKGICRYCGITWETANAEAVARFHQEAKLEAERKPKK